MCVLKIKGSEVMRDDRLQRHTSQRHRQRTNRGHPECTDGLKSKVPVTGDVSPGSSVGGELS